MKKDHEKIWDRCLEVIKDNVSQQSFKTWFEPIKALKLQDMCSPSRYHRSSSTNGWRNITSAC
jgi:hypothetical protein